MKTLVIKIATLSLLIMFTLSCNKETLPNLSNGNTLKFTDAEKSLLQSTNSFGINLFKQLGDTATSNLFISPLSVSLDLTMVYNGAKANTASQMQQVLGYGNLSNITINEDCQSLIQMLENADPNITFLIANSIWYRNTMTVKDSFINLNKTYFYAQVTAADFNNPSTVGEINNWAASNTDNKITQIITSIDHTTMMYLINALYFKGTWQYTFPTANTNNQNFYLSNGNTVSTPFMYEICNLKYLQNSLFSAAELPYGNGNFSMVVLVPAGSYTPLTILNSLSVQNWNNWNDSLILQKNVKVTLPKFTGTNNFSLVNPLKKLGITDAFSPLVANFSGIDGATDLYISDVKHFTYIDVDETGTEAAAVTITTVTASVAPIYEPILTANKPFVYFIKENTTNTILFAGIMENPAIQ